MGGLDHTALPSLLQRYARPGPRYTSYPSVPFWDAGFGAAEYEDALDHLAAAPADPLSIYVHLPFCARRCFYCGCNAVVNRRGSAVDVYLDHLEREVEAVVARLGTGRVASQLHWGGGTPNFLDEAQMRRLVAILGAAFDLDGAADRSIELDPRIASREQAYLLRELGFTRVSMGVQDMDPLVQRAIGRVQGEALTVGLFEACRDAGFRSINLDLVYGLPLQTVASFGETVDRVAALRPDRIAAFSYAHLPHLLPNQRAIDSAALPDAEAKMRMFRWTVERLASRGYEWIGLDHFAHRDDDLAVAARERRLLRNFMGYTTQRAPHLLGFGASAIGEVAGRFVQNDADLRGYQEGIAAGRLPVVRGHRLTRDDLLRQRVIQHLMCNLEIPFALTLDDFGVRVDEALAEELQALAPLEADGLVVREGWGVRVTEAGRFFVRNAAMAMDAYLNEAERRPAFSATV